MNLNFKVEKRNIMGELSRTSQHIGIAVEKQLNDVGIYTFEELKRTGTEYRAWLKNTGDVDRFGMHYAGYLLGAIHEY